MNRFGRITSMILDKFNVGMKRFNHYDEDDLELIRQVRKKTTLLLSNADAVFLLQTLEKTLKNVKGIIIEAGSALGGSALLIQEKIKDRKFFFIDPFSNEKEKIVEKLIDTSKSVMIKGYFPKDLKDLIENDEIAFAHIDTDVITKEIFEYLYKKMAKGGIALIHDYRNLQFHEEVYVSLNKLAENIEETLISYPLSSYAFFIKK